MALRVITLLLAVIMMTGVVTSVSADVTTSDDIASLDSDTPALDIPVVPHEHAVALPHRPISRLVSVPSTPEIGRMHAVSVFRPPRA